MKLLNYMHDQFQVAQQLDNEEFEDFVTAVDNEIRQQLNIGRGALQLPEDYEDVMDWLDGAPCSVLVDIDLYEGGVFYYYLCRMGLLA